LLIVVVPGWICLEQPVRKAAVLLELQGIAVQTPTMGNLVIRAIAIAIVIAPTTIAVTVE